MSRRSWAPEFWAEAIRIGILDPGYKRRGLTGRENCEEVQTAKWGRQGGVGRGAGALSSGEAGAAVMGCSSPNWHLLSYFSYEEFTPDIATEGSVKQECHHGWRVRHFKGQQLHGNRSQKSPGPVTPAPTSGPALVVSPTAAGRPGEPLPVRVRLKARHWPSAKVWAAASLPLGKGPGLLESSCRWPQADLEPKCQRAFRAEGRGSRGLTSALTHPWGRGPAQGHCLTQRQATGGSCPRGAPHHHRDSVHGDQKCQCDM